VLKGDELVGPTVSRRERTTSTQDRPRRTGLVTLVITEDPRDRLRLTHSRTNTPVGSSTAVLSSAVIRFSHECQAHTDQKMIHAPAIALGKSIWLLFGKNGLLVRHEIKCAAYFENGRL
jgi:hypothetical protein